MIKAIWRQPFFRQFVKELSFPLGHLPQLPAVSGHHNVLYRHVLCVPPQVSYLSWFNRIFTLILAAYGRFAEVGLKIKSLSDLSEAPGQGVIFALVFQLAHLSVPQLDCDLSVGNGGWEGLLGGGSEWSAAECLPF